jgi:hypothetical protein
MIPCGNDLNDNYPSTGSCTEYLVPAGGTILGGGGNCRRCGLAGRSMSLGSDFEGDT